METVEGEDVVGCFDSIVVLILVMLFSVQASSSIAKAEQRRRNRDIFKKRYQELDSRKPSDEFCEIWK